MKTFDLIRKRRSIRRFKQEKIPFTVLEQIIDSGRVAPSALNLQPLEFIIVDQTDILNSIFRLTGWAKYLGNDNGRPAPGEEPVAFIVVLVRRDCESSWTGHDVGAAVENMILTALEKGIGSCWIGSIQNEEAKAVLMVPDSHTIDSVLALGYPGEEPVVVPYKGSVKYYKDNTGQLYVPKRSKRDILHHNTF